jgi:hypothetical protein
VPLPPLLLLADENEVAEEIEVEEERADTARPKELEVGPKVSEY